ncbi:glyceraldehyde-3-phosphate dehydrogenase [Curtobacterium luteum]|uniref:Glyceraldehyde-3-phosphate dehydrogenase n=1 Tax=Curtobacterium luteum TaxID=33881 RepID=A0A175S0P8_9MICO|nr:glyceraldehyde-3-phosphate dehydrogenase [Curtobacterium luteum]KTR09352.1 glyceraldehyde-3-phosphate dehydrogenase [Curtobacterium luteum]
MNRARTDRVLDEWVDRASVAAAMVPIVDGLHRRHGVVTTIHGRRLVGRSVHEILKLHRFARHVDGVELSPHEVLPVLHALTTLDLGPSVVDVAVCNAGFRGQDALELEDHLRLVLAEAVGTGQYAAPPRDVVIHGFGRIGRLVARILLARSGGAYGLRLRAVVLRSTGPEDLVKRASLLRRDSVHGPFDGTITVDQEGQTITANGTVIRFIAAASPSDVDYTAYGIEDAIVVDSTGVRTDRASLSEHLAAPGVSRVLLTAPASGDVPNVVHGVNDQAIGDEPVVAAASCTTNAITPVLAALETEYGITHGHVETVHSFTNDQNLTDNHHPGPRRGRSAALNMVPTKTGAAKAVAKAYPPLAGKLTGSAIRVPTPDVSIAVLTLTLGRGVTLEELNAYLREVSLRSALRRQVDYVESPEVVSSDFLGSRKAGVVDGLATIADGGGQVVVYVWYDNEYGYSRQVVRVLETMSGHRALTLPAARSASVSGTSAAVPVALPV